MYQYSTRIGYSQIDVNGRLTPGAVINLFQDCVNFHSKSLGADIEYYREHKKAWILCSWQIIMDEYPVMGDEVVVTTAAYKFTPMLGMRNFSLTSPEGKYYVRANSNWVFIDTETGRPIRVTSEEADKYCTGDEPLDMEYAPRKLPIPKEATMGTPVRVMKYFLDTNNHMNNCQYVQLASEYLPDGFEIGQIRVEYKISAKYGDVIVPYYQMMDEGLAVELKSEDDDRVFAVVYLERRKA